MRMRSRLCSILALATCGIVSPSRANAQQASEYAYAFVGPAAVSNIGIRAVALNAGGGGELWSGDWISFGGELGTLYLPAIEQRSSCCAVSAPSAAAMLVSVNASRHFMRSHGDAKWQPFITGGASVVAGGEVGIRLEIRDQFVPAPNPSVLLGFRVGVVFR
jgi:hypothetical protein